MPIGGLLSAGKIHLHDNTVLKQPLSLAQKSLNLVSRSSVTTDFIDRQPVVNWVKGSWRTMNNCTCVTRFPPQLMLLKQLVCEITSCLTLYSFG